MSFPGRRRTVEAGVDAEAASLPQGDLSESGEVDAQTGKKLSAATAASLREGAEAIRAAIGC